MCDTYAMLPHLPMELWLLVAGQLVGECAIFTDQELWRNRSDADCNEELDISCGLWVRHVHIDGVRYIGDISNSPRPGYVMVLDAGHSPSELDALYSLQDHLGIRQFVFSGRRDAAELPPFPGRLSLSLHHAYRPLIQGLKLESITSVSGSSATVMASWLWWSALSRQQRAQIRFWRSAPSDYPSSVPHFLRMVSVPCNAPRVTGYSVGCAPHPMFIRAHYDGEEDDVSFYKDSACITWMFMPVDPGEHVSEIRIRRGKKNAHVGLMVSPDPPSPLLCLRYICYR